jgi:WD40 repeat protein
VPDPAPADPDGPRDRVLAAYTAAVDAGADPDPAAWAERHPAFAADLAEYAALRGWVGRAPAPPPTGRVGEYELLGLLGGGMGVVYRARHAATGRAAAVKLISAGPLATPADRHRFRLEAAAAARLDHPGVVPVVEVGEADGRPYIAMPLMPGGSLAARVAAGPADEPLAAAALVAALARAAHHAHQRGVLHRDIKPSNVLLDAAGRPHLADFGLARIADDADPPTLTGEQLGTPPYMAPERAAGRPATTATDVYGLGAVLYALLCGRPPFRGPTPPATLELVRIAAPVPPSRVNRRVGRDLEAVCLKCLAKDPAARYESAAALADDLDRAAAELPVRARRVGPAGRAARGLRRHRAVVAAAVVAAAGAAAVVRAEAVRRDAETARAEAAREVAAAGLGEGVARLQARRVAAWPGWAGEALADVGRLAALPGAAGVAAELRSEAAAALAAVEFRPVRAVGAGLKAYNPAFAPDGRRLALGGWGGDDAPVVPVRVYDWPTGAEERTLALPADAEFTARTGKPDGCRALRYSPDGRWLVLGTRSGRLARWDLWAPAAAPAVWSAQPDAGPPAADPAVRAILFAADGGTAYTSTPSAVRRWDVRAGWRADGTWRGAVAPVGTPTVGADLLALRVGWLGRLGPAVGPPPPPECRAGEDKFAVAPDGRLAAFPSAPGGVLSLFHVGGGDWGPRPLALPGRTRADSLDVADLAFSPDGTLLVTAGEADRLRVWDVAAGALASERRIDGGSGRLAAASPDGFRLAVTEVGRTAVYELTTRVRETVAVGPQYELTAFAAAPDGRRLTALYKDRRGTEVVEWDAPAGGPVARRRVGRTPLHPDERGLAAAAPDGRRVAFAAGGRPDQRLAAVGGGEVPAADVNDLRFAPDGRLWAADAHRVRVFDLPGWAEACRLENGPAERAAGMVFRAVAPGRRHALVGRRDGAVFLLDDAGPPRAEWRPGVRAVTALALSPDEGRAAVGGEDGEVVLLDLPAGTPTRLPGGHDGAVRAAAFGPGGWLTTAGDDGAVRVWSAAGEPVVTLREGGPVRGLAVAPDGAWLLARVDGERGLRRWRLDRLRAELAGLGLPAGDW